MRPSDLPLLPAGRIQQRVAELARDIARDFAGEEPLLVVVLKGAVVFAADLMRCLPMTVHVDFIRARSYTGTSSTGTVAIEAPRPLATADRAVIVVEDIVDTGRSLDALLGHIRATGPRRLALCALLDKPDRRRVEVAVDYTGFTIPDHFVVGYGLDYEEQYRNLPAIHVLE